MRPVLYPLLLALVVSAIVTAVLFFRAVGHDEHCEKTAFRIIETGSSSFADLLMLYEAYPATDAGLRIAAGAGICIGLAGHYREFAQAKPDEVAKAVAIALQADADAFSATEAAAITTAKMRIRDLRGR